MKASRIYLILLFILLGNSLYSQTRLSITSIQGLPNSGADTVYYNTSYNNIQITIKNLGNQAFQGEVDVMIMGGRGVVDTLFTDSLSGTQLTPNDSTIKFPASYLFNTVHYVDGDNIVVVWPQARTTGVLIDSLSFNIHYVSIQSVSELEKNSLIISPNPGTDFIRLEIPGNNHIEYVRIHDSTGRIVYETQEASQAIRVQNWKAGLYYIELGSHNSKYSGRLLIQ